MLRFCDSCHGSMTTKPKCSYVWPDWSSTSVLFACVQVECWCIAFIILVIQKSLANPKLVCSILVGQWKQQTDGHRWLSGFTVITIVLLKIPGPYTRFLFFYLFHFIYLLFVQSELHGLATLQWSTCQDSLSRYIFFW